MQPDLFAAQHYIKTAPKSLHPDPGSEGCLRLSIFCDFTRANHLALSRPATAQQPGQLRWESPWRSGARPPPLPPSLPPSPANSRRSRLSARQHPPDASRVALQTWSAQERRKPAAPPSVPSSLLSSQPSLRHVPSPPGSLFHSAHFVPRRTSNSRPRPALGAPLVGEQPPGTSCHVVPPADSPLRFPPAGQSATHRPSGIPGSRPFGSARTALPSSGSKANRARGEKGSSKGGSERKGWVTARRAGRAIKSPPE